MAVTNKDLATLEMDAYVVTGGNASASLTATGVTTDDVIIGCFEAAVTTGYLTDQVSATTISAADTIVCTNATNNDKLVLLVHDASGAGPVGTIAPRLGCFAGVNATTATCTGVALGDQVLAAVGFNESTGVPTDRTSAVSITGTNQVTQTGDLTSEGILLIYNDANAGTGKAYSYCRPKINVVTGAGASTNMAVTGIATTDELLGVVTWSATGVLANDLANCSITSAGNIQSTTNNSSKYVIVLWNDVNP